MAEQTRQEVGLYRGRFSRTMRWRDYNLKNTLPLGVKPHILNRLLSGEPTSRNDHETLLSCGRESSILGRRGSVRWFGQRGSQWCIWDGYIF